MDGETQSRPRGIGLARRAGTLRRIRRWLGPWPRRLAYTLLGLALLPFLLTLVYAVAPPPISNTMIWQWFRGQGVTKSWVNLDRISPHLVRAVITAEDARFCAHRGIDWVEFNIVIDQALGNGDDDAPSRGASTIPMQAAKNLFLFDSRSKIRKAMEIPLAFWMDLVWSKRRMAEVYLNIVEWAPGVYGAEAAARHHFKKSAAKLTRREAALLAAVLPNPIKRNAGKASRRVERAANRIVSRMAGMDKHLTCLKR
jgi:monofunctional glycosyltransferase